MSHLHPIFNVIKLLLTQSDPILGQKANLPPPPEIVDREEHYMVEWILDSQFMRGHLQFLVKWEGYGYEENSWVSEQDVTAPDKLCEFYWTHPGAPCQIHSMTFQSLMSHALRTQHTRGGVMSGDAPSHISASKLELRSAPLSESNSTLHLESDSTPGPAQRENSSHTNIQGWSEIHVVQGRCVPSDDPDCTVGNKTVWMFGSFGLCIEYIF